MYVKKEEKLQIIRWYIRKYVRYDKNLSAITNLKDLEHIVRTHTDIFGNTWECNCCFYSNRDYCPICKKCSVCHKNEKMQRIDILFRMDIGENFIYLKTDTSKRSLWLLFFVSMLFLQTINIR